RRRLSAELKKSRSTLDAVQADLTKFGDPERLKRYGDLILANIATARVEKGSVKVRDYYEPGEPEIEIEIGESPSLQKAATLFYAKYQKARRAEKTLAPRIRALKDRIHRLEEMLGMLSADPVIDRVNEIGKELDALLGVARSPSTRAKGKRDKSR